MTDQPELDLLLDAFFVDGTDELADRVIDAALDEIDHTQQRRVWLSRRIRTMNLPIRVAAAAAIGILAIGGVIAVGSGLVRFPAVTPPSVSPPLVPPQPTLIATPSQEPSLPAPSPTPAVTPSGPRWTTTGAMTQSRDFAMVTGLLADGKVLVVGGHNGNDPTDPAIATADLYDPASGRWTGTERMKSAHHSGHTVTPLRDGTVLVAGGKAYPDNPSGTFAVPIATNAAELLDPSTGRWTQTGNMTMARTSHIAIVLLDGSVLVVGGDTTTTVSNRTAEIFDPRTRTWAKTASMTVVRVAHTASLLPDGRVLVVGVGGTAKAPLSAAEVYDPAGRTWAGVGSPGPAHCFGLVDSLAWLRDGRLLSVCGTMFDNDSVSAALFDPTSARWTATGTPLRRAARTSTLLADGRVLVSDFRAGELYDPTTGAWADAGLPTYPDSRMSGYRVTGDWYEYDTATLLRDGRVLLTIGSRAIVYDPAGRP